MSICLCYHDEQNFLHERGVCYGTKEKEPCSCGGNPVMCDFYEEVREKYIHRTNYDRLVSKSPEELSIALCRGGCPPTAWDENGVLDCPKPNEEVCEEVCGSCWLDWLKEEVKE